jgi:phosphoglycerol geranylgeranyltransferase
MDRKVGRYVRRIIPRKGHRLKRGRVEKRIDSIIAGGRGVFMGLIDPEKHSPQRGAELARLMYEGGADVIMLGGSIGAQGKDLDEMAKMIKESVSIPLHLFPGNVSNITSHADSMYFMSLLNSKNPYWITGAQALGAPMVLKYNIEAIPTAYMVFEPGQTVGYVGEANLLPRDKPDVPLAYALAAEYMGMRFVILESGSGAPEPVPLDIVSAIRESTKVKIVIAGGVKTPEHARSLIKAGANCIHIGTKIEDDSNPLEQVKKFARAIHAKK